MIPSGLRHHDSNSLGLRLTLHYIRNSFFTMKKLQDSSLSSVEEKSFDENSSQELSLESLSEISGASGVGYNVGWLLAMKGYGSVM